MSIDNIVRRSLTEFIEDIFRSQWYGKEREAISLYAFGYLLKHCQPNAILQDPRQIGIEIRVPKPTKLGKKVEVCKDLVIWRQPSMTCWTAEKIAKNYPLAVLQWKVNEPEVSVDDVEWLRAFSEDSPESLGYAICVDLTKKKFRLKCTRVQNRIAQKKWLVL